ncbi:MAG: AAA family ATPase, partial [Bacteroidales bacterium]|nr:AAA family ATPase [Bacteroidales bacterium]
MKFPIGIQTFEEVIGEGYVYVDKTDMVYSLATEGKIYFLGRPRRFGKSLLLPTLERYFLAKREIFKVLKLDSLEKEWKTYPVCHMDFNGKNLRDADALTNALETFVAHGELKYDITPLAKGLGDR